MADITNLIMQATDAYNQQIFQREDSAVQRRVADLKAAGLSPILAANGYGAGVGGQTVGPDKALNVALDYMASMEAVGVQAQQAMASQMQASASMQSAQASMMNALTNQKHTEAMLPYEQGLSQAQIDTQKALEKKYENESYSVIIDSLIGLINAQYGPAMKEAEIASLEAGTEKAQQETENLTQQYDYIINQVDLIGEQIKMLQLEQEGQKHTNTILEADADNERTKNTIDNIGNVVKTILALPSAVLTGITAGKLFSKSKPFGFVK